MHLTTNRTNIIVEFSQNRPSKIMAKQEHIKRLNWFSTKLVNFDHDAVMLTNYCFEIIIWKLFQRKKCQKFERVFQSIVEFIPSMIKRFENSTIFTINKQSQVIYGAIKLKFHHINGNWNQKCWTFVEIIDLKIKLQSIRNDIQFKWKRS